MTERDFVKLIRLLLISLIGVCPLYALGENDPDAMYLITTPLLQNTGSLGIPLKPVNDEDAKTASAAIPYPAVERLYGIFKFNRLHQDNQNLRLLSKLHARIFEQVRGPKVAFYIPRFEIFSPQFTFARMLNVHILGDMNPSDLQSLSKSGVKHLGEIQLTVDTCETAGAFLGMMGTDKRNLRVHIRRPLYCGNVIPAALTNHVQNTSEQLPLRKQFPEATITLSFDNQGWLSHLLYPSRFSPEIQTLQSLGINIIKYHQGGLFWVCKQITLTDFTRMMGSERLAQTLHFLALVKKKYSHQLARPENLWALGEMTKFKNPHQLGEALRFLLHSLELSPYIPLYPLLQLFEHGLPSHQTLIQGARSFIESMDTFPKDHINSTQGYIALWVMENLALWPPEKWEGVAKIAGEVFKRITPPCNMILYASHVSRCISALQGLSQTDLETAPARVQAFNEKGNFQKNDSYLFQLAPFVFLKWGHLFGPETLTPDEQASFLKLFERIYDVYYPPSARHCNEHGRCYHSRDNILDAIEPEKLYGPKLSGERETFLREMTGLLKRCPPSKRMKLCAETYTGLKSKDDIGGKDILKSMKTQLLKVDAN